MKTSKVCPYCKKEFSRNDDLSICKECNTVYHSSCRSILRSCGIRGCSCEEFEMYANTDTDLINFLWKKQDYYMKKFDSIDNSITKHSWNWPAFLFGPLWYAYRKMYGVAAVLYVLNFAIGFFSESYFVASTLLTWIIAVFSGLYGNYIYKRHIKYNLRKIFDASDAVRQNYIMRRGGVSEGAVFVFYLGEIAINFFVIYIITMLTM